MPLDFLSPWLQQINEGTRIREHLRDRALMERRLQFQQDEIKRNNTIEDISRANADYANLDHLRQSGREVSPGGMVDLQAPQQQFDPVTGAVTGSTPINRAMPADPKRLRVYRMADGSVKNFESLNQDELDQKKIEQYRTMETAQNSIKLANELAALRALGPEKVKLAGEMAGATTLGTGIGQLRIQDMAAIHDPSTEMVKHFGIDASQKISGKAYQDYSNRLGGFSQARELAAITDARAKQQQEFTHGENVARNSTALTVASMRRNSGGGGGGGGKVAGGSGTGITATGGAMEGAAYMVRLHNANPGYANHIQALVDGRETAPMSRTDTNKKMMDDVHAVDPEWSKERATIRRAFASQKDGQNIQSINTAIVHVARLDALFEDLDNGPFTPLNASMNWLKGKIGAAAPATFEALKNTVAAEMARALTGTATIPEIEKMSRSIHAASSPAAMKGVVREFLSVLGDKANTYTDRYRQYNASDTKWSPILPHARVELERRGLWRNGEPAGPMPSKVPPPVGAVIKGYRFMGGDANDQKNWKAAQ